MISALAVAKPLNLMVDAVWHAGCKALGDRTAKDATMPNLFTREDTMLGICEGLGEELGVPSNLLRVAFALGLFWNPVAVIATYLALGVALALFRWTFPAPTAASKLTAVPPTAENDDTAIAFAQAA